MKRNFSGEKDKSYTGKLYLLLFKDDGLILCKFLQVFFYCLWIAAVFTRPLTRLWRPTTFSLWTKNIFELLIRSVVVHLCLCKVYVKRSKIKSTIWINPIPIWIKLQKAVT